MKMLEYVAYSSNMILFCRFLVITDFASSKSDLLENAPVYYPLLLSKSFEKVSPVALTVDGFVEVNSPG